MRIEMYADSHRFLIFEKQGKGHMPSPFKYPSVSTMAQVSTARTHH